MTKEDLEAKYQTQHNVLTRQFYQEHSLTKAQFDQLHTQNWQEFEQLMIAEGYMQKPLPPPPDPKALWQSADTVAKKLAVIEKVLGLA